MNTRLDPALVLPLHALLEEGTVSKAAQRLGRSQPAMSHVLARLRVATGDPLLVARGRTVELTPRALALVEPVRRLVAELDGVLGPSGAHFEPATSTRRFTVQATELLQALLLPALAGRLGREAPSVQVAAGPIAGEDLGEKLNSGALDLGITNLEGFSLPAGLRARVVVTDRYCCIVRVGHPAASAWGKNTFSQLEHVAVSPRAQRGGPVDRLLADRRQVRRVVLITSSFSAAIAVVASTDLAAIVPERALSPGAPVVSFEPPFPMPPIRLAALWAQRVDRDAGHRWFRSQVASVCRDLGAPHRASPG